MKTSLLVGQYLRMRRRYASIEICGTLRAWNASTADADDSAVREAEKTSSPDVFTVCGEVAVWDNIQE